MTLMKNILEIELWKLEAYYYKLIRILLLCFNVLNNLLSTAKYASDMLQSNKIDLSKALDFVINLVET